MLTDTELIRKLDFFEPLDQKIIKRIASVCIVREFSAGEAIVRQGESGLGLYFITGGRAKVEVDKDGTKVVVAELKEGDFLGEFSLIDDKTRSASVVCLQDTRCLLLTRDSFARLLKKYPEIAIQMLRTLVGRIRNTNERISQPAAGRPAAAPAAAPAPAPAAPGEEPAPTAGNGRVLSSLEAATDQIVAVIPKPEDILHFYSSTKGKTQEFLNNLVGSIYAMRAIMRFSMAIVGCPVRVVAEQPGEEVAAAEINGVKVVLFPADTSQTLRMEAFDDGMVEAAIYRPGGPAVSWKAEVTRLQAPVFRDDILRVHLLPGQPVQWETVRPRPGRLEGGTVSEQNQRALPMRERGGWVLENFSGQRACIRISSRCAAPEGGRADSNPWIPPHQEKGVCG